MNRILIAYDGSETSKKAIDKVEQLLLQNPESKLCLLSIFNQRNPYTNTMMGRKIKDEAVEKIQRAHEQKEIEEYKKKVEAQLEQFQGELKDKGLNVEVKGIVLEGDQNPGEDICKYAETHDFDMIVVGSRGLGNIKKMILGSVSNYVVTHSTIPVLIIK